MNKYIQILQDQRDEIYSVDVKELCPRYEEHHLNLNSSLAQIVIGVRRSGKSTMCQKVLLESNVNFGYVNFDDERLASLQSSDLNDILQDLYSVYGQFTHLFFDEIQNVEAWPLFVNRLLRQKIHIIMTGSNANLLSSELVTHMTGRYNQIVLYPFSFAEYCDCNDIDVNGRTTKAAGLRMHALNKYLLSGGLPELVRDEEMDSKMYVQSLLRAIVEKDICRRYNVRYKQTLYELANHLIDWFCQEKSLNSIAKELSNLSIHTVKNYLSYFDNAYLLRPLRRFSYKSMERSSSVKHYVVDNSFVTERENVIQSENLGWRLENTVAVELMRRARYASQEIYYLRKNRDYEVDFAVVDGIHVAELIQVTYDFLSPQKRLFNREIGGLVKGAKATRCSNLTLVMMAGEPGDIIVEGYTVHKVLATDWLLSIISHNL